MNGDNVSNEFIQWFATLGVGGVLAAFMFHFYRKDVKLYTDQWRGQAELLTVVIKDNTSAITRLVTLIDALHRRLDKDMEDREAEPRRHTERP